MQNKKIIILTDEKGSGKTTLLMNWCKLNSNIDGILTPICNSERMFYSIESKTYFTMLANDNENALVVGKYLFSKDAFEKANTLIIKNSSQKTIIIDEIGPLELQGMGLAKALHLLLQKNEFLHIVLVVRNGLANEVIQYFNLQKYLPEMHTCITFKNCYLS